MGEKKGGGENNNMKKVYGQVTVIVETPLVERTFLVKASAMCDIDSNDDCDDYLDQTIDLDLCYYDQVQVEEDLDIYLAELLEDHNRDDLDIFIYEESFSPF